MNKFANLNFPGKHTVIIRGEVGDLEVEVIIPENPNYEFCAVLGHPHSLHGGTMHNKVVTTLAASFSNLHIPSIKFNFRGVGKSGGSYDAGLGESIDMLIITRIWQDLYPSSKIIFAGFSFGSFVAYRAAAIYSSEISDSLPLITVAPSVVNYDYREFPGFDGSWLVVQGDNDEIVEPRSVYDFVESFDKKPELLILSDTTHFFHGKLVELKAKLTDYLSKKFCMGF